MKFKALIIKLLIIFTGFAAKAQYGEVGLMGGGTNFIGDVGDYGFHLPKDFCAGVFFRYNLNRHWALRAQANFGRIQNDDALSSFAYRQNRNLSFQSDIWEGYIAAEFNFLEYEPGSRYTHTPFITGGFGIFKFDPVTEYNGERYRLQPLGTEGQETSVNPEARYALGSGFFMFGLGYKWAIGEFVAIGIESTFRCTNTDYLDDVSGFYADPDVIAEKYGEIAATLSDRSLIPAEKESAYRGNPETRDWYIFTGVTLQFGFGELYEKCASFVGK